jgi:hypothetical protein
MRKPVMCTLGMLAAGTLPVSAAERLPALKLTTVTLSAHLQEKLRNTFGASEGAVLQKDVADQFGPMLKRGCGPDAAAVEVSIEDADPSHPTRKQLADRPSGDLLRTKYLGGARLSARLLKADTSVLLELSYNHYPATLKTVSTSGNPWADAHSSFGQFADKMKAACKARVKEEAE